MLGTASSEQNLFAISPDRTTTTPTEVIVRNGQYEMAAVIRSLAEVTDIVSDALEDTLKFAIEAHLEGKLDRLEPRQVVARFLDENEKLDFKIEYILGKYPRNKDRRSARM